MIKTVGIKDSTFAVASDATKSKMELILKLLVTIAIFKQCVSGQQIVSRPYLNIALNGTVVVAPSSDSNCRDYDEILHREVCDVNNNCNIAVCDASCPTRDIFPQFIDLTKRVASGNNACISLRNNTRSFPRNISHYTANDPWDYTIEFQNTDTACDLIYNGTYLTVLKETALWNLSFTAWVMKGQDIDTNRSLLYLGDANKSALVTLYITGDLLAVSTHNTTVTFPQWNIPSDWFHLMLQVYNQSVRLYIDGVQRGADHVNLALRPPSHVTVVRLGRSSASFFFTGLMHRALLYLAALTDRESQAVYEGTSILNPASDRLSQCRCPASHPILSSGYCSSSENASIRVPRLLLSAYKADRLVDGDKLSYWLSQLQTNDVNISITFNSPPYQVHQIGLNFLSVLPKKITIYKLHEDVYHKWHIVDTDCSGQKMAAETPNDVICQTMPRMASAEKTRKRNASKAHNVLVDLIGTRPRLTFDDDIAINHLVTWAEASTILVHLEGFHDQISANQRFYGINEIIVNGTCNYPNGSCYDCACHPLGSPEGATCHPVTHQCPCIASAGDPSLGGTQCRPYVNSVYPTYGPEAGGTLLVIEGGYWGDMADVIVYVGPQRCHNHSRDNGTIRCTTAPLTDPAHLGQAFPVFLKLIGDHNVSNTALTFTYSHNPIVSSISPRKTFVSGGVIQTVTGQYLTSVAEPRLTITAEFPDANSPSTLNEIQTFTAPCQASSPTEMTCDTPDMSLPERIISEATLINKPDVEFYIGFRLDGLTSYTNMSNITGDANDGMMQVYNDIYIIRWDPEVQSFFPRSEKYITIQGERLLSLTESSDYNVTVGGLTCDVNEVRDDVINCEPPGDAPPSSHPKNLPVVQVEVRQRIHHVGYLRYDTSLWEYMPFRISILVIVGLIVGVVFTIPAACEIRRHRRSEAKKQAEKLLQMRTAKGKQLWDAVRLSEASDYGGHGEGAFENIQDALEHVGARNKGIDLAPSDEDPTLFYYH